MIETATYLDAIPKSVVDRYRFYEVGHAAAVMKSICPSAFSNVVSVLDGFRLTAVRLLTPGGNRGLIPEALDGAFHELGWVEARVDTERISYLIERSNANAFGTEKQVLSREYQQGYYIDNVKESLALDVEWNPKDGNLDRDLSAYRAWHELGLIVGAVMITRVHAETRDLTNQLWADYITSHPEDAEKKQPVRLTTTTTANFEKAMDRIKRGDAGTCPILLVGIGNGAWDGVPFEGYILKRTNNSLVPQHV